MTCMTSDGIAFRCARIDALDSAIWNDSMWISVPNAPVASEADKNAQNAAPGTSWFVAEFVNDGEVTSAKWMTTALGTYEIYINGERIGTDALKPGFTHVKKTRRAFTYDVTPAFKSAKAEKNFLAAEVSAGWWRDKIVNYTGAKSAFRAVLEVVYKDGSKKFFGTDTASWKCAVDGPVKRAAIFDGEHYDARIAAPYFGNANFTEPEENTEFQGEILPTCGAEICRRCDIALKPVIAYAWKGITGAGKDGNGKDIFGKVVKTREFDVNGEITVEPGETVVVDFGQNCAGVPRFEMMSKSGTVFTCLPGEMLNDANGERSRGNDGPGGSLYRENLRMPETGMQIEYTFASDDVETYMPRFTFFGYRYVSMTATDTVTIKNIVSVPVTSISKDIETGKIETGDKDVNRLIANVYWGQLSNYLSVTTDCPQRNERLGWTADTQVFAEAGSFNADTSRFFHKWTRDLRDNQDARGGYPGVAPWGQYGNEPMRLGWADVGIIVPWTVWKQFGDKDIVKENWAAMDKYIRRVNETKYEYEATKDENGGYQWADWLSFEDLESCSGKAWGPEKPGVKFADRLRPEGKLYWNYLGASYWYYDATLMAQMASAIGEDPKPYEEMAAAAKKYVIETFFNTNDGLIVDCFRGMQTPAVFALKFGFVEGEARKATIAGLVKNIEEHNGCLQTGFLGTSFLMDTLTAVGEVKTAYSVLLNHNHPGWLYSVDQGATTIWERWNSYVKETGFGPVGMNSFNHYAYGSVLAWIYKTAAGIAADPSAPGYKNIIMSPVPDKRLGFVKAEYKTPAGLVKSAWRYEGEKCIWDFTIPEGTTASVTLPGEKVAKPYKAGTYSVEI